MSDLESRRGSPTASPVTNLAYLWGADAYSIERAVRHMAEAGGSAAEAGAAAVDAGGAAAAGSGDRLDIWALDVDQESAGGGAARAARLLDQVAERLGTATLFGGGTLVVLRQPTGLLRDTASRDRLMAMIADVPAGNGLAFTELTDGGARTTKATDAVRDAVRQAGGVVREFPALTRDRMERWIGDRAGELGLDLGPGAARLLAERVGAYVRENDVDRRRQTEVANGELEKLALLRPAGTASREDVADSVPEAIPGSTWAFLDAVAARHAGEAARIVTRLIDEGTPLPVLVVQLHRRLRELIVVGEHLSAGQRPSDLVRELKLQPFRAQKLAEQAAVWSGVELEAAIEGLLALDLASKGISLDGRQRSMSDARSALGLQAWLAGSVVRAR